MEGDVHRGRWGDGHRPAAFPRAGSSHPDVRNATFSLLLLGLAIATISPTAYRGGERWAWLLLAALTLGYIAANIAIHLAFGDTTYFPLVISQLAVAVVGLALPARRVFRPA